MSVYDIVRIAYFYCGRASISISTTDVDAQAITPLGQAVHRLSRRLRKRTDLALSASQMSALITVERHGEMRLGELARLEQISKSTMTRLVSKLEAVGFIHRWVDLTTVGGSW